jgi:transcriptional regulator with XRE-family HTH domain
MSGSAILVKGIKTRLKAQGISYHRLAELIGVSEPTVKRDLARGNFSLQRLDRICGALGVSVADLVQPAEHAPMMELSEQQEQALVTNPRALVVTYLIANDWKFDEIVSAFQLDENQLVSLLLKLDELRIVDFHPPKRMRKLTARNFSWRRDGAVQEYFLRRVIPEFFNARFDSPGDEFRFVGGLLSSSSMLRLQASIRRFAADYEQLAHQDARLPLEERHGCSAILALRSWEYSEFSKLRRNEPATHAVKKTRAPSR